MKIKAYIYTFLVFAATAAYSHAQSGYRGILPGSSTKARAESILGAPVKVVSATLSEYAPDAESDKIYVQYRADSNIVERIELLYNEGLTKTGIVAKLKLPPESAWKVNARGNVEEYYSARNIVLTFEGEDKSGGVRRVGYYSAELFATILPAAGAKSVEPADNKVRAGSSVSGMPEPPSEWMRAATKGDSNTMIMRQDSGKIPDRTEPYARSADKSTSLDAYAGVYEFRGASTPSGLATGTVEVDDDRLIWKSRYASGPIRRVGGGSKLDKDGVTMSKFITYVLVDNEDIRLQFTVDNGRVLHVAFFDMSPGKSVNTIGFRRGQ